LKQCEWCSKQFSPSVSYQIYCCTGCRDEATKEKIAERHKFLKIKNRRSKVRFCAGGCGGKLSVYNEDTVCASCSVSIKEVNLGLKEIKRLINEAESKRDE
jgi:hypothetical protein